MALLHVATGIDNHGSFVISPVAYRFCACADSVDGLSKLIRRTSKRPDRSSIRTANRPGLRDKFDGVRNASEASAKPFLRSALTR